MHSMMQRNPKIVPLKLLPIYTIGIGIFLPNFISQFLFQGREKGYKRHEQNFSRF